VAHVFGKLRSAAANAPDSWKKLRHNLELWGNRELPARRNLYASNKWCKGQNVAAFAQRLKSSRELFLHRNVHAPVLRAAFGTNAASQDMMKANFSTTSSTIQVTSCFQ
jgi:hypothetical protein